VVNRVGVLSGKHFFGTGDEMKELLEAEGIFVKNDKVIAFKELFWDPNKELIL
jgi:methylated-DNA-protein-cysteine methyltransferase-like protein